MEDEFAIRAGQSLDNLPLAFRAYGLLVDNLTNQWYYETTRRRYIPPYQSGVTVPLAGTTVARLLSQTPGTFAQAAPLTNEYVTASYFDQPVPGGQGVSVGPLGTGPAARPVFYGQQIPSGATLTFAPIQFNAGGVGPGSSTLASFTVPANSIAYVEVVHLLIYRDVAPTTVGTAWLMARWTPPGLGAYPLAFVQMAPTEATLLVTKSAIVPAPGFFPAGTILDLTRFDGGVGGSCGYWGTIKYMLFAAP